MADERKTNPSLVPYVGHESDYQLFGFLATPTAEDLRKKYKASLLADHPDRGGSGKLLEKFHNTYQRLTNPEISYSSTSKVLWDCLSEEDQQKLLDFLDKVHIDKTTIISDLKGSEHGAKYTLDNISELLKAFPENLRHDLLKTLCESSNKNLRRALLNLEVQANILLVIPAQNSAEAKKYFNAILSPTFEFKMESSPAPVPPRELTLFETLPPPQREKLEKFLSSDAKDTSPEAKAKGLALHTIQTTMASPDVYHKVLECKVLNPASVLSLVMKIIPSHLRLASCEQAFAAPYDDPNYANPLYYHEGQENYLKEVIVADTLCQDEKQQFSFLKEFSGDGIARLRELSGFKFNSYGAMSFIRSTLKLDSAISEQLCRFLRDSDFDTLYKSSIHTPSSLSADGIVFKKFLKERVYTTQRIKKIASFDEFKFYYLHACDGDILTALNTLGREHFFRLVKDTKDLQDVVGWATSIKAMSDVEAFFTDNGSEVHYALSNLNLNLAINIFQLEIDVNNSQHVQEFARLFGKWNLQRSLSFNEKWLSKQGSSAQAHWKKDAEDVISLTSKGIEYLEEEAEKKRNFSWWLYRFMYYVAAPVGVVFALSNLAPTILTGVVPISIAASAAAAFSVFTAYCLEEYEWCHHHLKGLKIGISVAGAILTAFGFTFLSWDAIATSPIAITGDIGMSLVSAAIAGVCMLGVLAGAKLFAETYISTEPHAPQVVLL